MKEACDNLIIKKTVCWFIKCKVVVKGSDGVWRRQGRGRRESVAE